MCPESTSGEGQGATAGGCLWCCSPTVQKLCSETCVQVEWYLPLKIISSFISQYLENWTLDIFLFWLLSVNMIAADTRSLSTAGLDLGLGYAQ